MRYRHGHDSFIILQQVVVTNNRPINPISLMEFFFSFIILNNEYSPFNQIYISLNNEYSPFNQIYIILNNEYSPFNQIYA